MTTALVTGASGFVGRHLVSLLIGRGYRVRCLVRQTSSIRHLRKMGAELRVGSLSQQGGLLQEAVAGCDVVFHAAGLTRALHETELMRVNSQGTGHLAQACSSQATPPVLVVVSSVAAAGPSSLGSLRTESDPPLPISAYGRSKRAGEVAAEAWAASVPTTIVRPGIVFGPWGREVLPIFKSIYRLGIHPVATFAPPPLSMIYAEDLAELLLLAAERGSRLQPTAGDRCAVRPPGYYFACASTYPTYAHLGRMIGEAVGRRHVFVWHFSDPFPWLLAGTLQAVGRLRQEVGILNADKLREACARSWAACPAAAEEDLGFHPPLPLQERIQQTADWYRQRGWL